MTRTKLIDRKLPNYTKGEETFNMVSHIVGGGFAVIAMIMCVIKSFINGETDAVFGSFVYGLSLIAMYTMSSVYHGLKKRMPKLVMQVLDHCTIYFLIAGTYTPILLCSIRKTAPVLSWILFAAVWLMAIVAAALTAVDLKKYSKFSMICYIGMGWSIILAIKPAIESIAWQGLFLLFAGGIAYSVGAVLYNLGKSKRYMHAIFHVFVLLASILHFLCIFLCII